MGKGVVYWTNSEPGEGSMSSTHSTIPKCKVYFIDQEYCAEDFLFEEKYLTPWAEPSQYPSTVCFE